MNSPSPQEEYLHRKPAPPSSSFFDWLFCCSADNQLHEERAGAARRTTVLAKRPLKPRCTVDGEQNRVRSKENRRGEGRDALT